MSFVRAMLFWAIAFAITFIFIGCRDTNEPVEIFDIGAEKSTVDIRFFSHARFDFNDANFDVLVVDFNDLQWIANTASELIDSGVSLYILSPTVSRQEISEILDIPLTNQPIYNRAILLGVYITKIADLYIWTNHYASIEEVVTPFVALDGSDTYDSAMLREVLHGDFSVVTLFDDALRLGYVYESSHEDISSLASGLFEDHAQITEFIVEYFGDESNARVTTLPSLPAGTQIFASSMGINVLNSSESMGRIFVTQYVMPQGQHMVNGRMMTILDTITVSRIDPTRNNAWVRRFDTTIDAAFGTWDGVQEYIHSPNLPSGVDSPVTVTRLHTSLSPHVRFEWDSGHVFWSSSRHNVSQELSPAMRIATNIPAGRRAIVSSVNAPYGTLETGQFHFPRSAATFVAAGGFF